MTGSADIERVADLLRQVSAEQIMPRFGRLASHDIQNKPSPGDPDDIVSDVDREVEAWLTAELTDLLEGSIVIGEEAVQADLEKLTALGDQRRIWLIDPIDGTRNFVQGDPNFGVMVTLIEHGRARAGWIALPALGDMFIAEEGAGAYRNGVRLHVPEHAPAALPLGDIHAKFMPAETLRKIASWPGKRFSVAGPSCAAVEYTALARGYKDFSVYYRLLPWDHAAGTLILREAGGTATYLDGLPYRATQPNQIMIAAASLEIEERVRSWFNA